MSTSLRRIGRSRANLTSIGSMLLAGGMVAATLLPADRASANVLAGTNESVLTRQPQLRPGALGDGAVIGLQYADPAEQMVVMDPPQPSNQGGAQLQHPLLIPAGRGIQPNLVLNYDSTAGSSWVGTGWNLSVGEISVDTRWGVPRYDPAKETETYLLDGDVLSPTAVRNTFQNRVADRSDFTHRVENAYNLIIRHGNSPKTYWWEVRDKMGGIRWYGGFPDDGGPDVNAVSTKYPSLKQDPSAILFDANGNAVRWALSAQRDVGVNMIRYFYETVPGTRVGEAKPGVTTGKQLYLSRIRYTEASGATVLASPPGVPDDAAYEVRFLRDGSISPAPTPRKDVLIDARSGVLQVTSDLLRRVEIWHGKPNGGAERSYSELSRRYDLNYQEGAFGKTLLKSVDQVGSDSKVYGSHVFDYYDEVRNASGTYQGFTDPVAWNTGTDSLTRTVLGPTNLSALGASETNSGDVHAYIGFNPADPLKEGSFGGSITINGGATEAQAEMIDINGDGLPDKVFRDGGVVSYRLNTSGPTTAAPCDTSACTTPAATFGAKNAVVNLSKLSTEADIGLAGGAEAHVGVDVEFILSGDVTIGEDYFTDVNGDGLADFVSAGTVYFNHVDPITNAPTFETSSDKTAVPINVTTTTLPASQQITDLEAKRRAQSPLQDTLRRWVAPFNGTIAVVAPVTLNPPPVSGVANPPYLGDGVKAEIQKNGTELWRSGLIITPGVAVSPTGVDAIPVVKGDRIYFRVQSIDDGARDQVTWDPTVTYTFTAPTDVNGLSQSEFQASKDFTLAGRPHTLGIAPLAGTLVFNGTLRKTRATSDDVTVQVLKNGGVVFSQVVSGATISPAAGIALNKEFDVAAPTATVQDKLEVRIAADSPIDVTALQLDYTLAYKSNPAIALNIPGDIDIYPENTLSAPRSPWVSNLGGAVTTHASLTVAGGNSAGDVNVTVKSAAGVVARGKITVPASSLPQTPFIDIPTTFVNGTNYWFDFSIREPGLSSKASAPVVVLKDGATQVAAPPSVLNWAGQQGFFPLSYRGWGFAGYNGDGARAAAAINEPDFTVNQADFPTNPTPPTGFGDTTYKDPSKGPAYAFIPAKVTENDSAGNPRTLLAWRGMKDSLLGTATAMRSSRTGADSPSLGINPTSTGGGVQAVRRVGIAAPVFSLTAGLGPLSGSFGVGPSFGLQDFTDMNGDGFPDIVGPGYIKYTGPRGGFYDSGSGVSVVNQDTTFAVTGGLGGSAVDIKSNSKGDVNSAQKTAPVSGTGGKPTNGSAAATGESAAESQYGFNVGGSIGISASFTNPGGTPNSDYADALKQTPVDVTAPFELTLADVNGDGLPDRVKETPQGVFVQFNLGYGFSDEVPWSGGGFETNESYSGTFGPDLGFKTPSRSFSAGLGLSQAISLPRYVWIDVDGDGILDQLHKSGNQVTVAFGTNSGLLPEVPYGTMSSGTFDLLGGSIPVGQQIASDVSTGLGAGADFTVGIGPLCLVACYLIINPGVHFDHSVSNTQVALIDVNGDGAPDSVISTADNAVSVRLNKRGKTNLLQAVHNPLGGTLRLGYQRDGNTVAQPNSIWTMSRVEVDDGRPGDGVDVKLSTYEYSGARYNKLEREMLGYSSVVERQRKFADSSILRSIEQTYLNDNVFDSGLLVSQVLKAPDGRKLQETDSDWSLIDLKTNAPADLTLTAADPTGLRLLDMAVAAVQTKTDQRWFDPSGNDALDSESTFTYDALGNVISQIDLGDPKVASDDLNATMEYTGCDNASTPSNYTRVPTTCNQAAPLTGGVPPFWNRIRNGNPCPTWTSLPAMFTVRSGQTAGGPILRQRNGAPSLCDNSSVTDQREWFGTGANDFVESLLSYDAWGSYNHIDYPETVVGSGQRLTVDYVYDDDGHANVAKTTDSHGLTATATFDGRTGRIASRTDANGQVTSYTYDAFSRIETITGPYEQGTGKATVRFEYRPDSSSGGYTYAVAHNFDVRNPNNTIDTATFVDGVDRQTQTKQDATVYTGPTSPATDVMVLSPFTEYDDLGRPIHVYYPITEPLGSIGTYNKNRSAETTKTTIDWDLLDRQTQLTAPGSLITTTRYEFGTLGNGVLFKNTVTAPPSAANSNGKPQTTWVDVHGRVLAIDDGTPAITTKYTYDALGQLLTVTDPANNKTNHTYDLLGRRTSTQTPDGGRVEFQFDGANNMIAQITPNLRNKNQQINYSYDIDRLVSITYPDGTPNVAYTYGGPGAPGNTAGRAATIADGARTQQLTYDALGAVASEVATMNLHNGPSAPHTTSFTHDGFGRLLTLTYPDGEVLSHQYDSGGLLSSLEGVKDTIVTDYLKRQEYDEFQSKRYQEFGNGVRTEYNFTADTRRLDTQVTNTPVRNIQSLHYSYDKAGNITALDNQAPPPQSNLLGGSSKQNYTYDTYDRVISANGFAPVAPNKRRDYTYAVTYDSSNNGNIASKIQTDVVSAVGPTGLPVKPQQTQDATTYSWNPMNYNPSAPHQLQSANVCQPLALNPCQNAGANTYSYDLNGNFTRVVDPKNKVQRTVTWDAANRVRNIDDGSTATDYLYDQAGLLGVQRGPQGELAFVNNWYQTTNDGWTWRQIWADEDRIAQATEQVDPLTGLVTPFRYYQHEDLQGSSNFVTDATGLVFEHVEYFPSGEMWIQEKSTTHRTPYRYVGSYNDEVRNLDLMGQRWYQPREQAFYSPEPMLYDDPTSTIGDPALLPAYTYAESNGLRLYDDNGNSAQDVHAKLSNRFSSGQVLEAWTQARRHSRLWQSLVRLALTKQSDDMKAFTERFEVKPLLEINLTRTDEGHQLQSVEAGFLRFGKTLWEAPLAASAPAVPPRPVGPAPIKPGAVAGSGASSGTGTTPRVRKPLPPIPTQPVADNSQAAANNPRPTKPLPPIPGKSGASNKPGGGGGSNPAPDSGAP